MKVCLGEMHGKPVMLTLKDGIAYIDGEPEAIKNLTDEELDSYQKELDSLPHSEDPGYQALVNSVRAAFIARLLGKAVGDDAINRLTQLLDLAHYDVLKYLGEVEE